LSFDNNNQVYNIDHHYLPRVNPSWLIRKLPGYYFYPRMIAIVWWSARLVKKGEYTSARWVQASRNIVKLFESLGTNITVENHAAFQNLDAPCVFIGNHMSTLETFALPGIIQPFRDVTFIVKKSLIDFPVFKHVMRSRDPIIVGRENPKDDFKVVLDGGLERLNRQISIIVFPQTTRSTKLDPKSFNSIGIKLAKRAGAPVVPIALKTDAWGVGSIIRDFGKIQPQKNVHFCFGDPITVTGNGREAHQAGVDFITNKLKCWIQD